MSKDTDKTKEEVYVSRQEISRQSEMAKLWRWAIPKVAPGMARKPACLEQLTAGGNHIYCLRNIWG